MTVANASTAKLATVNEVVTYEPKDPRYGESWSCERKYGIAVMITTLSSFNLSFSQHFEENERVPFHGNNTAHPSANNIQRIFASNSTSGWWCGSGSEPRIPESSRSPESASGLMAGATGSAWYAAPLALPLDEDDADIDRSS